MSGRTAVADKIYYCVAIYSYRYFFYSMDNFRWRQPDIFVFIDQQWHWYRLQFCRRHRWHCWHRGNYGWLGKLHIYQMYHSVCPLVGNGSPTSSPASGCAPPSGTTGAGVHSPAGEGVEESQFQRLEKSLALCILCGIIPRSTGPIPDFMNSPEQQSSDNEQLSRIGAFIGLASRGQLCILNIFHWFRLRLLALVAA